MGCWHCRFCHTCFDTYRVYMEHFRVGEQLIFSSCSRSVKKIEVTMLETFQEKAIRLVFEYVKARLEKTDTHVEFSKDQVYVVWFVKVLQNWKVLISTTLPDGMYYEVTFNGDRYETYIDAYKKFDNVLVPDEK